MELTIRPMTENERKYSYRQSQQLTMQCANIGYLRGDFSKSGTEFHTTWFDGRRDRKTDEFKAEFDDVINALRENLLEGRGSMTSFCGQHPDSRFESSMGMEYGFRADTEKYAYMVRCSPALGNYDFYVFAYVRDSLNRNIDSASRGIRFIDSNNNELFRIKDGESITITDSDGGTRQRVCRYIDEAHLEVGSELLHILIPT